MQNKAYLTDCNMYRSIHDKTNQGQGQEQETELCTQWVCMCVSLCG